MATKKILTIGLELASDHAENVSFSSKTSLLDWDIVLFRPDIDALIAKADDEYQGKPSLDDSESFRLKESCEHWRRELRQAFDTGKTVFIFLSPLREIYVDSGKRSFSGTGRNQRTTVHVGPYSNFESIPMSLGAVQATGTSIKLAGRGSQILTAYWEAFGKDSHYQVLLTSETIPVGRLVTKNGDKPVGAIYRSSAAGTLLLLPDLDFVREEFFEEDEENQETDWTSIAEKFADRLIDAVVGIDRALKAGLEFTPEPSWAGEAGFALPAESGLRIQLLEAESQVEQAQKRKEMLAEELRISGSIRALLYEKGKPLEDAIIQALRQLGFTATPFRDSESEFDVAFESSEGRLIGEAEGKDNKAINIDKLRQLSMNIQEDIQREEVCEAAKGVLFGNAFRLQPLADRADPFTEKCQTVATSLGMGLIFTPDLFPPIQYLLGNTDAQYD